jgi:hypothetical protein
MKSVVKFLTEILALAMGLTGLSTGQVTTAQYGNARTGAVTTETALNPANVRSSTFGKLATFHVDGDVYAQPLFVPRLDLPNRGTHDVLFVATEHGTVYAFDAMSLGSAPLWKTSFIDPVNSVTPLSFPDVMCPFIDPDIGITPTPVIDLAGSTMYVLMRTKEPARNGDHRYVQRLHALNIRTGAEKLSPVEIRASVRGNGDGSRNGVIEFDPLRENPRAALLLDRGVVYLSWASSCDVGPYHGWIMAYDAKTLKQLAVFNATPRGSEAGIWQGDAGLAADPAGNVYAVTGNGTYDEGSPPDYGNTVLKLGLTSSGFIVRDYFTPSDQTALSKADLDLGSGGPLLLPDESGPHQHLVFVTGKAGVSYLIDRDKMGHYRPGNDPHAIQTLHTSESGFGSSAYWNHTLFVWGSNDVLKAYRVAGGRIGSPPTLGPTRSVDPGAMPVVSSNGDRNGIVWAIQTRTWRGADKPAVLHAYDATDVRRELYNSEMNASRDRAGTALRFAMPTVASGRVFVGAKREVNVYGLLAARR